MVLKPVLAQSKPGLALYSGFQPLFNSESCEYCDNCIDICPADALSAKEDSIPGLNLDQCFGCGVCACNCPSEAILMENRPDVADIPVDRRAMMAEIMKAYS
jgi:Pyruvate/2-oxoacid:ferredoxin oxidoreductase delta subunit